MKRSRFIASVVRAETEAEARSFVDRVRKDRWDARHHCSAFVLGSLGEIARSSDDGEPAGTAGAPMLEVLRGAGLSDVAVVVTRYFGGVLLGAGGLVRAYGDAVRGALERAGVQERHLLSLWDLTVDHADAARLQNELRSRGVVIRSVDYTDRATLHLATDDDLEVLVRELSSGLLLPSRVGELWVDASH